MEHLEIFRSRSAELEQTLGFALDWDARPDAKFSFAGTYLTCDPDNRALWPEQHAWLAAKLARMQQVFARYIEQTRV